MSRMEPRLLKYQYVHCFLFYVSLKDFYVVSEWSNQLFKSEGIPFSVPIIQEDVAKIFKANMSFLFRFVRYFLIVVKDRHERLDKVMVCEDFEDIRNLSDCNLTRIQNHLLTNKHPSIWPKCSSMN